MKSTVFLFLNLILLNISSPTNAFQTPLNIKTNFRKKLNQRWNSPDSIDSPAYHHHTAIRTRNIENAIKFYSLFGFEIETKFRAGPARAAWLTTSKSPTDKQGQSDVASRLEVIEVPGYVLNEKEGTIKRAFDLLQNESLLGINHYALDVTSQIKTSGLESKPTDASLLEKYLEFINVKSKELFGKTLRVGMPPKQQVIGNQVFEICFLYDADGCIIELVRYIKDLEQKIESGWEPWDGSGFVGVK